MNKVQNQIRLKGRGNGYYVTALDSGGFFLYIRDCTRVQNIVKWLGLSRPPRATVLTAKLSIDVAPGDTSLNLRRGVMELRQPSIQRW